MCRIPVTGTLIDLNDLVVSARCSVCESVCLPVNNSFAVFWYILVPTRGADRDVSSSRSGGCGCVGEIVVSLTWCIL